CGPYGRRWLPRQSGNLPELKASGRLKLNQEQLALQPQEIRCEPISEENVTHVWTAASSESGKVVFTSATMKASPCQSFRSSATAAAHFHRAERSRAVFSPSLWFSDGARAPVCYQTTGY